MTQERGDCVCNRQVHRRLNSAHRWLIVAALCWLGTTGCATIPYRYGHFRTPGDDAHTGVAFEYGKPQKTLDRIAYVTGIWSRFLSLNSRVNNHSLSDGTKEKLIAYLDENELNDVLIRVNQYDPKGEWHRLRENHRVARGWRYTAGLLSLAHYTIFPGRVLGGDQYNPFTNTLYLNSDVSAVVLHEAAYAKDVHSRLLPGTYAFVNEIPILALWRHTNGVNDILGYAQINDDWPVERETYCVVYPQMGVHGAALVGAPLPFWDGMLCTVAGAAVGHTTGRIAISRRMDQRNRMAGDESSDDDIESDSPEPLVDASDPEHGSNEIRFTSHQDDPDDKRKTDGGLKRPAPNRPLKTED